MVGTFESGVASGFFKSGLTATFFLLTGFFDGFTMPFCKWMKKYLVAIATKGVCVCVRERERERETERESK